jgi:hypothetical protein
MACSSIVLNSQSNLQSTSSDLAGTIRFANAGGYGVIHTSGGNYATIQAAPGSAWTYTIPNPGAAASFVMTEGTQTVNGAKTFGNDVIFSGNVTVNGTQTIVNSTTVSINDNNFLLNDVTSPSDANADGGGITLAGSTNKTFNWVDATDAWTSSEHLNLLTGKAYYINGVSVLNSTTLGSGVTGSSLTSVGTITTGIWNGTDIAVADGGTGASTVAGAKDSLNIPFISATTLNNAGSPYTLTSADAGKYYLVDTTSGSVTVNIPVGSTMVAGDMFGFIKTASANTFTLSRQSSDTINGGTTKAYTTQYASCILVTDASTNWTIVAESASAASAGVTSFNSRTGAVSPTEGDYSLSLLSDVNTLSALSAGHLLQYSGSAWDKSGSTWPTTVTTGQIIYASNSNVLSAAAPGVTSGVQPYDAFLTSIAAQGASADQVVYTTATDTATSMTFTSQARGLVDDTTYAAMRTTLLMDGAQAPISKTVDFTTSSGEVGAYYNIDTTSGAVIATMNASPAIGDMYTFRFAAGSMTNAVTLNANTGKTFDFTNANTMRLSVLNQVFQVIYAGSNIWHVRNLSAEVPITENFVTAGAATATLTYYPINGINGMSVFLNGVYQVPTECFTYAVGTRVLTMGSTPASGMNLTIHYRTCNALYTA